MFKKRYPTTRGLYIGKPEAEAETIGGMPSILDFFEDYTHIEDNINQGSFIISGRKGSGKSAYAMWLKQTSSNSDSQSTEIIRKNEFDTEAIIQAIPITNIKYEAMFEWLILVRLVKMIIDTNEGTYLKQIKSLKSFYEKNSGYIEIDKYVIAEIVQNKEVNFSPLKKDFGFITRYFGNKSIKAPFYQMISPLRDTICEILRMEIFKNRKFYVLFDDLDVKLDLNNSQDCAALMDLIRIVRRYMTEYFNGLNVKVLIFVRDDIADRLEGTDSDINKIFESYEYRINWYEHINAKDNERSIMLRRFINRRISKAFESCGLEYNNEDPWCSLVYENHNESITQFKYILDHTFYLPRDLILIFKDIQNKEYRIPLNHADINLLLKDYSKKKASEIKDELAVLYDEKDRKDKIDRIFEVIKEVNDGWNVEYRQVLDIINKYGLTPQTFNIILDYSLLVPVEKETGHLFFNYREREVEGDWEQYTYRTPKVLTKFFQTR